MPAIDCWEADGSIRAPRRLPHDGCSAHTTVRLHEGGAMAWLGCRVPYGAAFESLGVQFAFPTQTLYLAGDPNREPTVKTS